jgi:AcrR family transcriptional regulator
MHPPDAPSPRPDAARNRARILEAARQATAQGEPLPGLNDLARRAGVGVATVYRHFADQSALTQALAEENLSSVLTTARVALAETDPLAGLEHVTRATLTLALADPSLAAVLASSADDPGPTAARLAELDETVAVLLSRGRRAGLLRPDVTASDLRLLVCGLERAARASPEPATSAERYAGVVLAGLHNSHPPQPPLRSAQEGRRRLRRCEGQRSLRCVHPRPFSSPLGAPRSTPLSLKPLPSLPPLRSAMGGVGGASLTPPSPACPSSSWSGRRSRPS